MKKLWFLLLAICLISFLAGCDDGGGNGTPNISTYVITDHAMISGVTQIDGGIHGILTTDGDEVDVLQTITLNFDDNTFTFYYRMNNITTSSIDLNVTFSGKMELSGSTLALIADKQTDNDTSVETPVTPPEPYYYEVTANTLEDDLGAVYTKQ